MRQAAARRKRLRAVRRALPVTCGTDVLRVRTAPFAHIQPDDSSMDAIARASPSAPARGATSNPFTPSVSHSLMPPTSNAIVGRPSAAASSPLRPNGSGHRLGITADYAACADAIIERQRHPVNSSGRRATERGRATLLRCGLSPAMITFTGRPRSRATCAAALTRTCPPLRDVMRPAKSTVSRSALGDST